MITVSYFSISNNFATARLMLNGKFACWFLQGIKGWGEVPGDSWGGIGHRRIQRIHSWDIMKRIHPLDIMQMIHPLDIMQRIHPLDIMQRMCWILCKGCVNENIFLNPKYTIGAGMMEVN